MSKQIGYELDQYDEYMERAQHVVESGSVARLELSWRWRISVMRE